MPNGSKPTEDEHFIPRMYLRNFSVIKGKRDHICQFDTNTMQQAPTSVKLEDVCCEKNLYELRDSDGSFIAQNHIENNFGQIEDYTARVIKSIVAKSQNEKCLNCSTVLSQDEKSYLTIFITALLYRDPQTIEMGMKLLQGANPSMDGRETRNFTLMNLLPLGVDSEWDKNTVIRSAIQKFSGMFFQIGFTDDGTIITSDRPVIQWPSHDNSDDRPRAVTFPLTSRLVLYLFPIEDAEQNEISCFFKMSEQQIDDIQANIAVCARRWIYSRYMLTAEQLEIIKAVRDRLSTNCKGMPWTEKD